MKKTISAAVALSVFAAPAIAANLENPLYMPKQGMGYSKTSAGVMYKVADDTEAMKLIQSCEKKLNAATKTVNKLVEANGKIIDFEVEE